MSPAMTMTAQDALCEDVIARHSKSFALAAKLLPSPSAHDAVALYAWCRRADDAIDLVPPSEQPQALARLRAELASVYRTERPSDPVLAVFQAVVRRCAIPKAYPAALLDGMEMDVLDVRYYQLDELLLYCHRVAGTVGLMMCHVLGVSDQRALRHAAHLGMAMQLTNICRDVEEDGQRGRCYVPAAMHRALPLQAAVASLLRYAGTLYRSGDQGLRYLPWRAGLSIRVARLVYAAIGWRLAMRGYDVLAGRTVVPTIWKLALVAWAGVLALLDLPRALLRRFRPATISTVVRYPGDVFPV